MIEGTRLASLERQIGGLERRLRLWRGLAVLLVASTGTTLCLGRCFSGPPAELVVVRGGLFIDDMVGKRRVDIGTSDDGSTHFRINDDRELGILHAKVTQSPGGRTGFGVLDETKLSGGEFLGYDDGSGIHGLVTYHASDGKVLTAMKVRVKGDRDDWGIFSYQLKESPLAPEVSLRWLSANGVGYAIAGMPREGGLGGVECLSTHEQAHVDSAMEVGHARVVAGVGKDGGAVSMTGSRGVETVRLYVIPPGNPTFGLRAF